MALPPKFDGVAQAGRERGRLVIVCGLPGSGKTTLARQLAQELRALRLCPDEWLSDLQIDLWDNDARGRLEALQWKLAQRLLALGCTVILEWGVWAREERDALRERARELGATVELRYLDVPLDELVRRVEARNVAGDPNAAIIRREHLEEWSSKLFEPPTDDELALYD